MSLSSTRPSVSTSRPVRVDVAPCRRRGHACRRRSVTPCRQVEVTPVVVDVAGPFPVGRRRASRSRGRRSRGCIVEGSIACRFRRGATRVVVDITPVVIEVTPTVVVEVKRLSSPTSRLSRSVAATSSPVRSIVALVGVDIRRLSGPDVAAQSAGELRPHGECRRSQGREAAPRGGPEPGAPRPSCACVAASPARAPRAGDENNRPGPTRKSAPDAGSGIDEGRTKRRPEAGGDPT